MRKGSKVPPERLIQMREISLRNGSMPPNRKGAKMSEDAKRRISETCKARGIGKWMIGKKHAPESIKKMSINNARYWAGKIRGKQSEETVQKRINSLKGVKRPDCAKRWKLHHPTKGKFGREHPAWREEKKTPLHKAIRKTFKYRKWRMEIFTRDDFTCVLCRQTKCFIEADHCPKKFIDIIHESNIKTLDEALLCNELWDIKNGRTLCKVCHRQTETWGRRKPDLTKLEKYVEFHDIPGGMGC